MRMKTCKENKSDEKEITCFMASSEQNTETIIEDGDQIVPNSKENWIDTDKKMMSQNSKAKSILCCSLSKKEFNRISACKSAKEMWDKLKLTYEGIDKTPNVTAIEEANDLYSMSLEKLSGSLIAYEINMERLGESTSKKKVSMTLKTEEPSKDCATTSVNSRIDSEEDAFLSRCQQ
ncbi:hypothetical protein Taro_005016 [Colocasia esculenta]|uniref:Uncharacterized protein n=1 Tax=Colocasia esculenta TaxID=4460 RepID=A0A843TNX0_COLES|nr:hypothetical protein [Colocasia esculenta]